MAPDDKELARLHAIKTVDRGLSSAVLESFVDKRLHLARAPRRAEREALDEVVRRFRRGRTDICLSRLQDAVAFVRLLGLMGFSRSEILLSQTSRNGRGLPSDTIHDFLTDRAAAPRLAGRSGWKGSLVVRFRPEHLFQPVVASRACRFALIMLAMSLVPTTKTD